MARIAGVNIPNHQHTVIGLTAIYGVGRPRAQEICANTGVLTTKKVKDLDDNELEKLRDEIAKFVVEGDLRACVQNWLLIHTLLQLTGKAAS